MRIAYLIINHNRREGTSKAIAEVAEALAARHEVHVYSRSADGVDLKRVQWHKVRGPGYPHVAEFLGYVHSCRHALRSEKYDIIHAAGSVSTQADVFSIQNIQPAKRAILEELESGEKVSRLRRAFRRAYLRTTSKWEKMAYERCAPRRPAFLPVSSGVERELRSFYDIGNAHCRLIPNGADCTRYKPVVSSERAAIRARWGLSENDFVFAFSGGEWKRKGLDLAIRALGLLKRSRAKLLVLGRDVDSASFAELTQECGVEHDVIFAGFQEEIEKPLASADAFLFPSRYEAFSLATLEAAACGLPIIASKINGTEDFILPGANGEFVNHDAEHISSVMETLISDLEGCRRMGANARERVTADYTWRRIAEMTEDCYRSVIDSRINGRQ